MSMKLKRKPEGYRSLLLKSSIDIVKETKAEGTRFSNAIYAFSTTHLFTKQIMCPLLLRIENILCYIAVNIKKIWLSLMILSALNLRKLSTIFCVWFVKNRCLIWINR